MEQSTMVRLKTGEEVDSRAIQVTLMTLRALAEDDFLAFYEFVTLCRNPQHDLFGNYQAVLAKRSLLDVYGRPHKTLLPIILAAVTGDDFDMRISDPRAA